MIPATRPQLVATHPSALMLRLRASVASDGVRPAPGLRSALLIARSMLIPFGSLFFLINTCTSVPSGISTRLRGTRVVFPFTLSFHHFLKLDTAPVCQVPRVWRGLSVAAVCRP